MRIVKALANVVFACAGLVGIVMCLYAAVLGGIDGDTNQAIKYMAGGGVLMLAAALADTSINPL